MAARLTPRQNASVRMTCIAIGSTGKSVSVTVCVRNVRTESVIVMTTSGTMSIKAVETIASMTWVSLARMGDSSLTAIG